MEQDTLFLVEQFKNTVAIMYKTLLQCEPIITAQADRIALVEKLGNGMIFICFISTVCFLYIIINMIKKNYGIKQLIIPKRGIIPLLSIFLISAILFNIIPRFSTRVIEPDINQIKKDLFNNSEGRNYENIY
jgi:hypothetical protein